MTKAKLSIAQTPWSLRDPPVQTHDRLTGSHLHNAACLVYLMEKHANDHHQLPGQSR
jgi:hypothetical protein